MRNNLWDWQSLSPTSGGGTFFEFCDALEVKNGVSAGAKGWGLDHTLKAWSTFWTDTYLPDDRTCHRFPTVPSVFAHHVFVWQSAVTRISCKTTVPEGMLRILTSPQDMLGLI